MKVSPIFLKRVGAYFIDLAVVYLFAVATIFFCVLVYSIWNYAGDARILKSIALSDEVRNFARVSHIILLVSYFTLAHWYYGKTVGKWAVGLELKLRSGEIGILRSFSRTLLFFLTGNLTFGLGFLVPLFRKDGKTLHDIICHTEVLPAQKAPSASEDLSEAA
jgi:uncharacterized RDD family membrane protein YckC